MAGKDGGLNENDTWSLVGGAVWEGKGLKYLWEGKPC